MREKSQGDHFLLTYIKPERIILKAHPEFHEKWVQARIAEDPKILGLGNLVLLQQERIQPSGGRLDLLFQDAEDRKRRYEIELQLGSIDETHIIRTLEYWDIERKRYPQYDHTAVIVAEDITSRFLNIVSLFNGTIPLIAIQMQAMQIAGNVALIFTTVIDAVARGLVDEDEIAEAAPASRTLWETQASHDTVVMVDEMLSTVKNFDSTLELKYNRYYIGLVKNDKANNFVEFRPRKKTVNLDIRLDKAEEIDRKIENDGLEPSYDNTWKRYRIALTRGQFDTHRGLIEDLLKLAYDFRNG
jgi:hypothetical protein